MLGGEAVPQTSVAVGDLHLHAERSRFLVGGRGDESQPPLDDLTGRQGCLARFAHAQERDINLGHLSNDEIWILIDDTRNCHILRDVVPHFDVAKLKNAVKRGLDLGV